jgi:hypothetical protein
MSFCQGTLEILEPGSSGSARNVTECSNRKLLFAFDPTEEWDHGVSHGPNLEWPRVISDDFHAFRMTTRSMAVMYMIGVGAIGSALVARVVSLIAPRRQQGLFEFGFLVVSTSSPCCCLTADPSLLLGRISTAQANKQSANTLSISLGL